MLAAFFILLLGISIIVASRSGKIRRTARKIFFALMLTQGGLLGMNRKMTEDTKDGISGTALTALGCCIMFFGIIAFIVSYQRNINYF